MHETLETLAARGKEGDRAALEQLIRRVQDRLYQLALRMLGDVDEAEDATQEIVLKVITRLGTFRGDSAFFTWAQAVASNHLLNLKLGRREGVSFEQFEAALDQGLEYFATAAPTPLDSAVVEEGKLLCTQAMLNCLDRPHRLAYVLGEVLELSSHEGAEILGVEDAAFRKRLSRAREQVEAFAQRRCGLVNPSNACRCEKQAPFGVKACVIDPKKLRLSSHPVVSKASRELQELKSAAALMRQHPQYRAPDVFVARLKELLAVSALR